MFKGFPSKRGQFNGFPNLNFQINNGAYGFSGLIHWYDAAYGTNTQTNGAAITSWQPRVGPYSFLQSTAANQPRFSLSDVYFNSYPAIDFYDTARGMTSQSPLLMGSKVSIAFVGYIYSISTNFNLIIYNTTVASYYLVFGGNNANVTGIGIYNDTASFVLRTTIENMLPHIVIFTSQNIIVDGVVAASGTLSYPVAYNRLSGTAASGAFNGKMAELLIYNQDLDSNKAIALSDNLNAKYAIY